MNVRTHHVILCFMQCTTVTHAPDVFPQSSAYIAETLSGTFLIYVVMINCFEIETAGNTAKERYEKILGQGTQLSRKQQRCYQDDREKTTFQWLSKWSRSSMGK